MKVLVNCYICGSKTPIPLLPLGIGDKVLCDECKGKYGKVDTKDKIKRCLICDVPLPKDMDICKPCLKKLKEDYYYTTTDNMTTAIIKDTQNQSAKADADKPILSLVPKQIIYEIEKVRAFGSNKYKDRNNWKKVELERYHEALLRHTLAIWEDIDAKDKESGLLHLSHMATNIAFILELLKEDTNNV